MEKLSLSRITLRAHLQAVSDRRHVVREGVHEVLVFGRHIEPLAKGAVEGVCRVSTPAARRRQRQVGSRAAK
jgi:hypothetical protein